MPSCRCSGRSNRTSGSKWTKVSSQGDGFPTPDHLRPCLTRCSYFYAVPYLIPSCRLILCTAPPNNLAFSWPLLGVHQEAEGERSALSGVTVTPDLALEPLDQLLGHGEAVPRGGLPSRRHGTES